MRNLIGLTPVGQQVRLTIERKSATEDVTVEIEPLPEQKVRQRNAS
jgi:serine protease Do